MALENLLGTDDPVELAHREEAITKRAALELYRGDTLDSLEPGTFETLAAIHRHLFCEVYAFAGAMRSVNLAKGGFRFASAIYLADALRAIDSMPQNTFDEIADKYVEVNVAHPFREGNGRAGRIWLDHLMRKQLGKTVDWSAIKRDDYLLAMERSPVRATELKGLLKGALSDDLNDPALLARGIDSSYAYEGYSAYRTQELFG